MGILPMSCLVFRMGKIAMHMNFRLRGFFSSRAFTAFRKPIGSTEITMIPRITSFMFFCTMGSPPKRNPAPTKRLPERHLGLEAPMNFPVGHAADPRLNKTGRTVLTIGFEPGREA